LRFHVSANGDDQAEGFDGEAAEDESAAGGRVGGGEQHQGGDGEKETGWHDQQSGKLHGRSFLFSADAGQIQSVMSACLPVQDDCAAQMVG
jgi:hypothetical protein